jgi:hypothetical protein
LPSDNLDVGKGEIGTLGQQRFTQGLGQSISKTIAKVEGCRVAAFALFAPGGTRNLDLFAVHGRDLEIGADEEEIEFPAGRFTTSGFQHDSSNIRRDVGLLRYKHLPDRLLKEIPDDDRPHNHSQSAPYQPCESEINYRTGNAGE